MNLRLQGQRPNSLQQKLFGPPRRFSDDSCTSATSSTSSSEDTTPESSAPTTPLDEMPGCQLSFVKIAGLDDRSPSGTSIGDTDTEKKKSPLIRAVKKFGSTISRVGLLSLKIANKNLLLNVQRRSRLGDVFEIFQKGPSKKNSTPSLTSTTPNPNDKPEADCEVMRLPAIMPAERYSSDSTTSLDAVHGSPTESEYPIPVTVDLPVDTPEALVSVPSASSRPARSFAHDILDLLKKAILFLPYAFLVGLAPFMFPTHLSALTFSSALGYAARPSSPFKTFGHHVQMLPYHVGIFAGTLGLIAFWNVIVAATIFLVVFSAAIWAWHDFSLDGKGSGLELGCDDRMSIYWIIKGVMLGDMVCSMKDFDWICATEDIYDDETVEDHGDFELMEEADGSVDCTIKVAGPGIDQGESELRIIVQCVE